MDNSALLPVQNLCCPICNGRDLYRCLHRKDQPFSIFLLDDGGIPEIDFKLDYCSTCNTVFSESGVLDYGYGELSDKIYQQYTLLDQSTRPFPSRDDYYVNSLAFLVQSLKFDHVRNVLEIGSNRGDFLYLLKEKHPDLNVTGVEPSKLPFYGVNTINVPFDPSLFDAPFDLIIIRHVLEHIADPVAFLQQVCQCLKANGHVFIEVPNFYVDLQERKETFIPEHIFYFTAESLPLMLGNAGMQVDIYDGSNPNGMYVIASKNATEDQRPATRPSSQAIKIEPLLSELSSAMENTLEQIERYLDEGYTLAFYGFGNIFLSTWAHISHHLSPEKLKERCLIIDDTPTKSGIQFKHIQVMTPTDMSQKKIDKLAVIICTMNRQHQEIMASRIRSMSASEPIIFYPWSPVAF